MSSSAVVSASTTDTRDVAAIDQGLLIQNVCEACEGILAIRLPRLGHVWRISTGRIPTDFQAAASGGCGICKLVIRSKTYKDEKWSTKKTLIKTKLHHKSSNDALFLDFAEDIDSQSYVFFPRVRLRLLEPQGINPELFGTLLLIRGSSMITETSRLKPQWLPPSSLGTESPESFNKLTDWLTTCVSSHAGCTKPTLQPNAMLVRMLEIDLNRCEPIERIRLQSCVRPTKYATLSYCWGPDLRTIPRLLHRNLSDRLQEIMLDALPRTFKDAVVCAYRLGIRYLWIDCLCIIQDSKSDWLQQSALMAEIYSNAFVNFAATASSSCDGGLFRSRSCSDVNPCIVDPHFEGNPGFLYHCVDPDVVWRDVKDGVLNTRGWTFQETLLAPRTLHFSETQIYWQCESLCASEIYVDELPYTTPLNGRSQLTSTGDKWWKIVEEYTSRSLTHENEDKLVALSGVARRVAMYDHLKDDEYLAGIWRHDLLSSLFWRLTSRGFPLHNGVPSWSWASISGNVRIWTHISLGGKALSGFDVIAAHVTPKADPYGQVRGGYIRLSTYNLGKGILSKEFEDIPFDDSGQSCIFRISGVPDSSKHGLDCWFDVRDFIELSDLSNIYYCFWQNHPPDDGGIGLFLEKVGTGKFKRIGVFDSPFSNFSFQRLGVNDYEYLDEAGQYTFSII